MTDAEPDTTADAGAVAAFYGRWARLYDLLAEYAPGIGSVRARAVEHLELGPGDTVVEMGCGTGANLPYLREAVGPTGRVIGVDLTPGMLGRARGRVRNAGWGNVHLVRGDATRPPVDGPVDAVLASFVVGMFESPAAVVGGWIDLLAPGGRIALLDAAPSDERPGTVLNPAFGAFTWASAPSKRADAAAALHRKVRAAREALADGTDGRRHETMGWGFLRLTSGRR